MMSKLSKGKKSKSRTKVRTKAQEKILEAVPIPPANPIPTPPNPNPMIVIPVLKGEGRGTVQIERKGGKIYVRWNDGAGGFSLTAICGWPKSLVHRVGQALVEIAQ